MKKSSNKLPAGTKKPTSGPGRPKKLDRDAVINLAMDTFWQKGPDVSLNSICELAGVAKPSLYREFGNEDGLSKAALERYFELSYGKLKELLLGPATFKEKLENLVTFVCQDQCNQYGCLFVKMRSESFNLGQNTKARVEEIDEEMIKLYINFFKLSRESGDWKSQLSDKVAAKFLGSQIELALTQRARGVLSSEVMTILDISLSVLLLDPH